MSQSLATAKMHSDLSYHLAILACKFSGDEMSKNINDFLNEIYGDSAPNLVYESHDIQKCCNSGVTTQEHEVQLTLKASDTSEFAAAARSFVARIFSSDATTALFSASECGLLGFRPRAGSDFEEYWNQAMMFETFTQGANVMFSVKSSPRGVLDGKWAPVWVKLLTFVVAAKVEPYLEMIPPNINGSIDRVVDALVNLSDEHCTIEQYAKECNTGEDSGEKCDAKEYEEYAINFLRSIVKDNTQYRTENEIKRGTKIALTNFFESVQEVSEVLPSIGDKMSETERYRLCNALVSTTVRAAEAFTCNEELLNHFIVQRAVAAASMIGNTFLGIWTAVRAKNLFEASKLTVPRIAQGGLLNNLSCWVGDIAAPTLQVGNTIASQAVIHSGLSVGFLWKAAYDGYKVASTAKKVDFCREASHLFTQVWLISAETYAISSYAEYSIINQRYEFVDKESEILWREILTRKLKRDPPEEHTKVEFLDKYLQSKLEELTEVRTRLALVMNSVFK